MIRLVSNSPKCFTCRQTINQILPSRHKFSMPRKMRGKRLHNVVAHVLQILYEQTIFMTLSLSHSSTVPLSRKEKQQENNINAQQIKPNTQRSSSENSRKNCCWADGSFIYVCVQENVVKKFYDQTLHFMCFYVKLPYNIGNIVS